MKSPVIVARNVLAQYGLDEAVPVNLVDLCDRLDIQIRRWEGRDMDGMALNVAGHRIIYLNTSVCRVRQRFTVAHELGHLLLGHAPLSFASNMESKMTRQERDANLFAGETLVPIRPIRREAHLYSLDVLASRYSVSNRVMAIQLAQLGLTPGQ